MDKTYDFSDTKLYKDIKEWEADHGLEIKLNSMFEGRGNIKLYEIDGDVYASFSVYYFQGKEIEIINTVNTGDYTLLEKRIKKAIESAYHDCRDIAICRLCKKSGLFVDIKQLKKATISSANKAMVSHLGQSLTGSGHQPLVIL